MTTDVATVDGQAQHVSVAVPQSSPADRIAYAASAASEVGQLIEKHNLAQNIQGRRYIKVEGWQLFAQALDMTVLVESVDQLPDGHGWRAAAVVQTADGRVVGRGQTVCTRDERRWRDADEYAVMSMAQTRSIGRACRAALGYVASAAGYEATPAEEMPTEEPAAPPVPQWALAADSEHLRASTVRALDAVVIPEDAHRDYGKALLQAVKAATGGALPEVVSAVLQAVADVAQAYGQDDQHATDAAAAAERDSDPGEPVDPSDVTDPEQQQIPGTPAPAASAPESHYEEA